MNIKWTVTEKDARRVRAFVQTHQNNNFVQQRIKRNLSKEKTTPRLPIVWKVLIGCLLTTQQRSGPESNVSLFLLEKPFLLNYARVKRRRDAQMYCQKVLTDWGGIRRTKTIALQASNNLYKLETSLWKDLKRQLEKLTKRSNPQTERYVADFVTDNLDGLGPKQSRNFLQWLGLTRYEIPIDSRITKWLNEFGFPIKLSASALSDRNYYHFVSDGIQALCSKSKIYPCVFDAAIFSSFDEKK